MILKTHGVRYIWITATPLAWLISVTFTAGWQKLFAADPKLGFLAHATALENAIATGKVTAAQISKTQNVIFNERLDAVVCGVFMLLVAVIIIDSLRAWYGVMKGSARVSSSETPFVPSQLEVESV
jgi:carbon starvation protein